MVIRHNRTIRENSSIKSNQSTQEKRKVRALLRIYGHLERIKVPLPICELNLFLMLYRSYLSEADLKRMERYKKKASKPTLCEKVNIDKLLTPADCENNQEGHCNYNNWNRTCPGICDSFVPIQINEIHEYLRQFEDLQGYNLSLKDENSLAIRDYYWSLKGKVIAENQALMTQKLEKDIRNRAWVNEHRFFLDVYSLDDWERLCNKYGIDYYNGILDIIAVDTREGAAILYNHLRKNDISPPKRPRLDPTRHNNPQKSLLDF